MEENKTFKYAAYIGVFIFIIAIGWYLLSEPNVSNQRDRANDVAESLGRAGSEQRNAESNIERIGRGIDESIGRADRIEEGIERAKNSVEASQERNAECAGILKDSERRISESRAILQTVRERARQN